MRRKIKLAALLLIAALLLTGCSSFSFDQTASVDPNATPEPTVAPLIDPVFTDRDAVYEWYNQVNVGDSLEDLTARFGEPVVEENDNGDNYIWKNEDGYGFVAVFYDNGTLQAKVVYYDDMRQFKGLSAATNITNFATLSTDHDFTMACLALGGKPCELAVITLDSSSSPDTQHLYVWVDENGSSIQILFDSSEKIKQIAYALADTVEE